MEKTEKRNKEQEYFELFCKDFNIQYDFRSRHEIYIEMKTAQAFAIYRFSNFREKSILEDSPEKTIGDYSGNSETIQSEILKDFNNNNKEVKREKTCDNCGYAPSVKGVIFCNCLCGEIDPRQPSLWKPKD